VLSASKAEFYGFLLSKGKVLKKFFKLSAIIFIGDIGITNFVAKPA
jgi:hypothetical protein